MSHMHVCVSMSKGEQCPQRLLDGIVVVIQIALKSLYLSKPTGKEVTKSNWSSV